jgi:hypothetical protein
MLAQSMYSEYSEYIASLACDTEDIIIHILSYGYHYERFP